MLTWSDIWSYIRIMLRWWWVALLAALFAASAALIFSMRQPDYYLSRATLRVGDTLSTAAPDPQMIGLTNTVASFYGEMAKREIILAPVVEKLGLPFPWPVIRDYMLATSVNRQASLLEITITDTNPQRAAAIANAIATELIQFGPNSPENVAAQRSLLNEQIDRAQREITALDRQIDQTRELLAQATSATDLREARNRLQELELARDTAQNAYTQLLRLQNTSMVNSLSVFEAAKVPGAPLPNKRNLTVAVAGLAGLLLGLMASFVLEAIDTRWRNHNDLRSRFGLNFLGAVPGKRPLIGLSEDEARMRAGAVKEAHTQIVLAGLPRNARILMVSGPRPSHERSALVIDLAHCYTLSGYRVLLVDAETEQAALSELFGDPESVLQPIMINGEAQVWSSLRVTPMKNVLLLARNTGEDGRPLPPSQPWPALVEGLQRAADILIFDGPSTLSGVEAALLAPMVDGVVLALKPAEDSSRDIQQSLKRLTLKRNDSVLGAVMLTDEHTLAGQTERPRLPLPNLRQLLSDMPLRLLNPGKGQPETASSEEQPANAPTPDSIADNNSFVRVEPVAGRVIVTPSAEPSRVIVTPPVHEHQAVVVAPSSSEQHSNGLKERALGETVWPAAPQQEGKRAANPPAATPPPARRRPIAGRRRRM
ncbi:lipopolysaccharide biosynthesis protein [Chloroflexus islandicus]|uniref:Lipopolysaccharide biosynthesis protein n=1 Tax=Chloroflexus islandicus TaxID=1707952 RepID=A0A178MKP2_9CHLR|nr:CpsD/CapB family tyrosine-protein kinase [Chloroflexus islandicus]OAN48574.1 lipopolysaccharide biosynthesis protein [Chloroflexus islandicus]